MPPISKANAEKQLLNVFQSLDDTEKSAISVRFIPDDKTRSAAMSHPSLSVWASTELNKFAELREVTKISRLLDLVLGLSDDSNDSKFSELFFNLLESAVSMLPLHTCHEFWPYLEARHSIIGENAQGPNSIVLLRMCRSFLSRLHPELEDKEAGKLLVFLAVVKGFGHASRLNKRGKISRRGYYDDPDSEPKDGGSGGVTQTTEDPKATPLQTSIQLRDLSNVTDPADIKDFLGFLKSKFSGRRFYGNRGHFNGSSLDLYGLEWRQRSLPSELQLLGDQAVIALSKLAKTEVAQQDPEIQALIQTIRSDIETMDKRGSKKPQYDSLFTCEQEWCNWKDSQCPYNEFSDVTIPAIPAKDDEPLLLLSSSSSSLLLSNTLPELGSNVGNARLTHLLQANSEPDKFKSSLDRERTAKDYAAQSQEASRSKSEREGLDFKSRRCQPWSTLLESQASIPENIHPELKPLEEKAVERNTHPSLKRSPSAGPGPETAPKRPRISYEEDTRYQDRQRGMQNTARPLPY